MTLEHI